MSHFCLLCEQSFTSTEELQQHLNSPARVFECDSCDKGFKSQQALRQHLESSAHVFECRNCGKSFNSQQALYQHLNSPSHAFESKDSDKSLSSQQTLQQDLGSPSHASTTLVQYLGIPSSVVAPIFATTRRLRLQHPTKDDAYIIRLIKSDLDVAIISSLVRASWRLLSLDKTMQGKALRTERQRKRAVLAKESEDAFFAKVIRLGYKGLRENQQRGEAITPDFRFKEPTFVCGHRCLWLEFKDFFGFRANPFVAASNKKQYKKYAEQIGPGAVVYQFGFETGHVKIDGVMTFREKEVLRDLKSQTTEKHTDV